MNRAVSPEAIKKISDSISEKVSKDTEALLSEYDKVLAEFAKKISKKSP